MSLDEMEKRLTNAFEEGTIDYPGLRKFRLLLEGKRRKVKVAWEKSHERHYKIAMATLTSRIMTVQLAEVVFLIEDQLKREREEKPPPPVSPPILSEPILSWTEQRAFDAVKDLGAANASQVAASITPPTSRGVQAICLSRLFRFGLLNKHREGKCVYYTVKER